MMIEAYVALTEKAKELKEREEGLALTEYVVMLGLITAALVTAVTLFGTNLANAWDGWAVWIADNTGAP